MINKNTSNNQCPVFRRYLFGTITLLAVFVVTEIFLHVANLGEVQIHRKTKGGLIVRKPHSSYLHKKENQNRVYYNNIGFHDRNRTNKASSDKRIVIIGDSFVEGAAVPINATFTRQAETLLSKKQLQTEVINAGTSGSNTGFQYNLWKNYLKSFIDIDILVLCLYLGDDLAQNHPVLLKRYLKRPADDLIFSIQESGEVQIPKKKDSIILCSIRSLTHHSRILFFLYEKLARIKKSFQKKSVRKTPVPLTRKDESLEPYWDESIRGTQTLIKQWRRESEKEGVRFALMVIPSSSSLTKPGYGHPALNRFVDELQTWAQKENVPMLKIDFPDSSPYELYGFDGKTLGHFGFQGHIETGRQLANWIEKELLQTNEK